MSSRANSALSRCSNPTSPKAAAGRTLNDFRLLSQRDKVRVLLGFVAFGVLAVLAILDSERHPAVQDFLEQFPRVTTLVTGGLAVLVGYLAIVTTKATRDRRINESVTSIGLAGLVRPLLGVNLVLDEIIKDQVGVLVQAKASYAQGTSPLKWTRPLVVDPTKLEELRRNAKPLDRQNLPQVKADMLDECVRDLVGSVRDWNSTLVITDLGRQGLFALQTLRSDLQMIQAGVLAGFRDAVEDLAVIRARVVFLAASCEAASMPRNFRQEVVRAVDQLRKHQSVSVPGHSPRLGESVTVREYLGLRPSESAAFSCSAGVMCNKLRQSQRLVAEEYLADFYREQDCLRALIGSSDENPATQCCGDSSSKAKPCHTPHEPPTEARSTNTDHQEIKR